MEDVVIACADLVGRTGATGFEIGFVHEDVPVEDAGWYATAFFRGARVQATEHKSPDAAALDLAGRLLRGAACRCGRKVALTDSTGEGCRWRLMGARWEPGCDAPPIKMKPEQRGDLAAMQAEHRRQQR